MSKNRAAALAAIQAGRKASGRIRIVFRKHAYNLMRREISHTKREE